MSNFEYDLEWRKYPEDTRYWISNNGDIMSDAHRHMKNLSGKRHCGKGKYRITMISGKNMLVHRLVAETFIGLIPEGMVVNHLDSNRLNNNVNNLEICTQKENIIHGMLKNKNYGSGSTSAKLNEKKVREIIKGYRGGVRILKLAEIYNVKRSTINNIINGITWVRVTGGVTDKKFIRRNGKLCPNDVMNIKKMIKKGSLTRDIMREYGICRQTACDIRNGKTWRSVGEQD